MSKNFLHNFTFSQFKLFLLIILLKQQEQRLNSRSTSSRNSKFY